MISHVALIIGLSYPLALLSHSSSLGLADNLFRSTLQALLLFHEKRA